MVALLFACGCVRFGYDARRRPADPTPDASQADVDGGTPSAMDGKVVDAETHSDASGRDASMRDAAPRDAAAAEGGATDATVTADAMPDALDAASTDLDASDDNPQDADTDGDAVDSGVIDLCPDRADALFCDGFEDAALMRWNYEIVTNGTLDRTAARFRSGVAALRATTGAAGSTNVAREGANIFGHQKTGELWARYYYYLPASTVVNTAFSTGVVAEIEDPFFGFALLVTPSRVDIGVFNTMYPGTKAFPRDHWTCVELHVQIDASAGIFEAYLDGALAARSPATNTLPGMGYSSLDVGIHYTDMGQGPVEAYVDDVVAGTTRAGCN